MNIACIIQACLHEQPPPILKVSPERREIVFDRRIRKERDERIRASRSNRNWFWNEISRRARRKSFDRNHFGTSQTRTFFLQHFVLFLSSFSFSATIFVCLFVCFFRHILCVVYYASWISHFFFRCICTDERGFRVTCIVVQQYVEWFVRRSLANNLSVTTALRMQWTEKSFRVENLYETHLDKYIFCLIKAPVYLTYW